MPPLLAAIDESRTPGPLQPSRAEDRRRWLEAIAVVLLLSPLWGALVWRNRECELDDVLIYLRYVRNFRDHGELVYNLGERFNGLTSALWTYVSISLALSFDHLLIAVNVASGICLAAAAVVLHVALSASAGRLAASLAAALVLSSPYFYACSGLETSLFLMLSVLSVALFVRGNPTGTAWALGMLLVTRSEAVFLVGAVSLAFLRQRETLPLRRYPALVMRLAAPSMVVFILNASYYGRPSPHTAIAKFEQGFSGYFGPWPTAFLGTSDHVPWFWGDHSWLFLAVLALSSLGILSQRGTSWNRVVLPFLATYWGTFVLLNVPNYHWYYAVFYFFGLAYAGIGISALAAWMRALPGPRMRALGDGAVVALTSAAIFSLATAAWQSTDRTGSPPGEYAQAGRFLASHTPPGSTVAAVEIGAIGWYSERPIIDILGLITPENSRAIARRDLRSWLTQYRPQFVVIHDPPWPFEEAAVLAERRREYADVPDFRVAGLHLLRRIVP